MFRAGFGVLKIRAARPSSFGSAPEHPYWDILNFVTTGIQAGNFPIRISPRDLQKRRDKAKIRILANSEAQLM